MTKRKDNRGKPAKSSEPVFNEVPAFEVESETSEPETSEVPAFEVESETSEPAATSHKLRKGYVTREAFYNNKRLHVGDKVSGISCEVTKEYPDGMLPTWLTEDEPEVEEEEIDASTE